MSLLFACLSCSYEPCQKKTCLRRSATSQDSNRPARVQKLAKVKILDLSNIYIILTTQRIIDTDQTASMRRLIWVFLFAYDMNSFCHRMAQM